MSLRRPPDQYLENAPEPRIFRSLRTPAFAGVTSAQVPDNKNRLKLIIKNRDLCFFIVKGNSHGSQSHY